MGEPLLHPELPLFLKTAKEKGFRSMITTNGTLIPKCGDMLLENGVHKVNLSIHSLEDADETKFLTAIENWLLDRNQNYGFKFQKNSLKNIHLKSKDKS